MAKPIRTVKTVVTATETPLPGIRLLVLEDEDRWELPPFLPGAHIDLHLGKRLIRTYSLCNAPHENDRYIIAVKHEELGRGGSRHVHEELAPGTTVQVSLPRGGMQIDPTEMNIFIAGGIGITPFVSTIRDMEARGLTNYRLYWSSNGPPSIHAMLGPAIAAGRVEIVDTTREPIPDLKAILASHGDRAKAFCCGPEPMLNAFDRAVEGWHEDRFHVERFTAVQVAVDPDAKPYTLVLAQSGVSREVMPDEKLVDVLIDMEVDIPFSCEGGVCGVCRTRWLEGPPVHNDRVLTSSERESEVIVCVAGCRGARLVLDA
ncbi:PDR/VanB family oxidoreductase [Cereibacter sp. SYSU M97828]|nr:PDR/VanB family oxidoreductase [Cereibacter flavus]